MTTDATTMGVVGLGYVGLPLALSFADAGYEVVCVDVDEKRVTQLQSGESYVTDVSDERVEDALDSMTVTTDYDALSKADGISVCVPTPLRKTGSPNMSYVVNAVDDLKTVVSPGTTLILESTVYPGATREMFVPALEEEGLEIGEDLFVAFSPERIDPGNEEYSPTEIPKVLGGVTPTCGDHAQALYERVFDEVVRVGSTTEAEMVKLLENTFRAVNIALINEIAQVAHELDVDIWSAIDAAATKPFGFMPFYPGPGLGGHCIPVDPSFLSWKANQNDIDTRFIDLADSVNRSMPRYVVERIVELVNDAGVAVPDARILILGVAYKPDVSDTRESPAADVMELLSDRGADVVYHDPHVPAFEPAERRYESVTLTSEQLRNCDCAVILTDHNVLDIDSIVDEAPLVFDARNATREYNINSVARL